MAASKKLGDLAAVAPPGTSEAIDVGLATEIVELAPDGILVSDEDGRILIANRHVEALFGYGQDMLVGADVDSLLPARSRTAHRAQRAKFVATSAVRPMGVGLELLGCRANGSEFPVEISLSPVASDRGSVIVVVIRDLSRQRAKEHAVRAALVREDDDRLAADCDGLIRHLYASGLTLAGVLGRAPLDRDESERIRDVIDQLDEAIREIRHIAFSRLGPGAGTSQSSHSRTSTT